MAEKKIDVVLMNDAVEMIKEEKRLSYNEGFADGYKQAIEKGNDEMSKGDIIYHSVSAYSYILFLMADLLLFSRTEAPNWFAFIVGFGSAVLLAMAIIHITALCKKKKEG